MSAMQVSKTQICNIENFTLQHHKSQVISRHSHSIFKCLNHIFSLTTTVCTFKPTFNLSNLMLWIETVLSLIHLLFRVFKSVQCMQR